MALVIPKTQKPNGTDAKAKHTSVFKVRPTTVAIVHSLVEGAGAARLLHALLELWVHADPARFPVREHDGQHLRFLILSSKDVQDGTGMSEKQLERAFADLKSSPYVVVKRGRLSPHDPMNRRLIHIRVKAIWFEVDGMMGATKMTLVDKGEGIKTQAFKVSKDELPYLFRRLFETAESTP
ncbi:hypothetical protein [Devosia faecipullorum]|uniref:hypothetical protein n=1 Tax=Devosia faecipullorum TaxID=2755039 RepID=UPI00187BA215|nr:hypothetical protein [Devosia faecipullorum]MBE7734424.1 hypothetical protein [Devosia faecipullorum]